MQIKILPEDIKWYIDTAPKFGKILSTITNTIAYNKELEVGHIIYEFEDEARSVFKGKCQFPFAEQKNTLGEFFARTLCVSINNCVAHGKPNFETKIIKDDVVKIDGGISIKAPSGRIMYFDSAITVVCGNSKTKKEVQPVILAPVAAIKEMSTLRGEINTRQLSQIIENYAEKFNLDIVTELSGHGIGYFLHGDPYITNMTTPAAATNLIPGTFICPEPMYMVNGSGQIATSYIDLDGWSVVVKDISSHWETILYYDGNKLTDIVGIVSS